MFFTYNIISLYTVFSFDIFVCIQRPILTEVIASIAAECMKATEVAAEVKKEAAVGPASGEARTCLTKAKAACGMDRF